jgi:integrase
MTDVELRYLDKRLRNGRYRWYFRHPSVPRTRVPGQPGEAAFQRVYARLLSQAEGERAAEAQRADEASIRSLVDLYRASDEWDQLADKTRTDYDRELDRLCRMAGDLPYAKLSPQGVQSMRSEVRAETVASRKAAIAKREAEDAAAAEAGRKGSKRKPPAPVTKTTGARTADYFKSVLSALYGWAVEHQLIAKNPAGGMRKLHRKKNVEAHVPWTEHQIQSAIEHGPRHIRDGVILGTYTGQRLGDCCSMAKRQCVGPVVRVKQQKTGNLVDVMATGPLVNLIARRRGANDPDGAPQLLLQDNGEPYSERLYSDHLRAWLDEQGWTDISFHGLRYSSAGTLNEAGATVATIVSIIGHSTYQMALKYLAAREDQKRAASLMEEAAKRRESDA